MKRARAKIDMPSKIKMSHGISIMRIFTHTNAMAPTAICANCRMNGGKTLIGIRDRRNMNGVAIMTPNIRSGSPCNHSPQKTEPMNRSAYRHCTCNGTSFDFILINFIRLPLSVIVSSAPC